MINTINIPDMIDQILYPESVSADAPLASGAAAIESVTESDKKFNESVNGAVIDSAEDDSAGKLMIVIYIY
jgi:hypothetical protein